MLRFGGAVQVALSLIKECKAFTENEYHIAVGPGVAQSLNQSEFPNNFHFYHLSFGVMGLSKAGKVQREMAALEDTIMPDCVVTSSGPAYWRSKAPHLMGFNLPLYIYPESPYLQNLNTGRRIKLAARKWLHCHFFRREADSLLVQTDDVNRRVRKLLKTDQVHTVTNSHSGWYEAPPETAPRLPQRQIDTFRFLTLTSYYAHKNLELIPQVIQALPEKVRSQVEFVLTLSDSQYRERIGAVIPAQVRLIGPVPAPECPSLYKECDAMFLPTLAECFSASYPEAMKMEKPILTTDLGFARSICGNAALYFTPCDAQSAANRIENLVSQASLRQALVKQGLSRLKAFDSARNRARKVLMICEQLVNGNVHARPA